MRSVDSTDDHIPDLSAPGKPHRAAIELQINKQFVAFREMDGGCVQFFYELIAKGFWWAGCHGGDYDLNRELLSVCGVGAAASVAVRLDAHLPVGTELECVLTRIVHHGHIHWRLCLLPFPHHTGDVRSCSLAECHDPRAIGIGQLQCVAFDLIGALLLSLSRRHHQLIDPSFPHPLPRFGLRDMPAGVWQMGHQREAYVTMRSRSV